MLNQTSPQNARRGRDRRRGALTVEFAITLPILLTLVFASIEFCSMNVIRHSVDNAAYEGARRAIVPGATFADVQATAERIMQACGARNTVVTMVPSVITNSTSEIVVTVTTPVAGNGWMTPMFFDASDQFVGECRLAREEM